MDSERALSVGRWVVATVWSSRGMFREEHSSPLTASHLSAKLQRRRPSLQDGVGVYRRQPRPNRIERPIVASAAICARPLPPRSPVTTCSSSGRSPLLPHKLFHPIVVRRAKVTSRVEGAASCTADQ